LGWNGQAAAQLPMPPAGLVLHNPDGTVPCIIAPRSTGRRDAPDAIVIDLRVPRAPASVLARLPLESRDLSTKPVEVFLVPAPAKGEAAVATPAHLEPLSIEKDLVRHVIPGPANVPSVRVVYPRAALRAGVDVVAQRTSPSANGESVVAQTRCRITAVEAAHWR
jgi:hypothetical protein